MESTMKENENFKAELELNTETEESIPILDIPVDTKNCVLMKSIFDTERPSTVFFQYNFEATSMAKKTLNNSRFLPKIELDWINKKNRNFCVTYKAYKNIPDCILIPMQTNGIVRTKSFINANLIWKLLKIDKMVVLIRKLNKYQRYNHFPCTWQIGRKDNLWKNYKIMSIKYPEDFDYIPHTFILPEDQEEMMKEIHKDMWMIKPVASSRGRGIRLMNDIESIPKKCLISKYVQSPHLINNKKYDLRLYVVITGFSPLKIYLYEEGLVRFASEDYSMDEANKHNRYMHLTNYSVNKCSSRFDKNISTTDECTGSKWSLNALRSYFVQNNVDFAPTWSKIQDIVTKSIISIADETIESTAKLTKHKNNLFELYGFDILIDAEYRPWLLEVNLNPSLNCESELDIKVKSSLMTDIYTLVGIIPYSHVIKEEKKKDPKLFHHVLNRNKKTEGVCGDHDNMTQDDSELKDDEKESMSANETIIYSRDEFSRQGLFNRVFPQKQNIDYYSKFMDQPGEDNLMLWKWMQNEGKENENENKMFSRVYDEKSNV